MRPFVPCISALLVALASCGGDSTSSDSGDTSAAADSTSPDPATTASATSQPIPTTDPTPVLPEAVPWDASRFDEVIEPTMAALAVGVGQQVSAAAVAPEVVLPEGVPTPGGTIVGAGWDAEFDPRRDEYELTYSVGLDSPITSGELEAWQNGVDDGWRAPSFSESGSLFTSLVIDEADQRIIHVLDTDAASSGRPPLNLAWRPHVEAIPEPDWLASLPRPEGGVLTDILVARGTVSVGLGGAGFDGHVFARFDYELDDFDRIVEYFESGILLGAGFEYEPEPISNFRYRRDVSMGDWSGDVGIGEASADGVEYLQVVWQLTRGAA